MKKVITILIILIFVYFDLLQIIKLFNNSHDITYQVINNDQTFTVNEKLIIDKSLSGYLFNIELNKIQLNFQIFDKLDKSSKIIKDIKYIKGSSYHCLLPIFTNNKIYTDIMCINNNIVYNYSDIQGQNKTLDDKIKNLKEYNIEKYDIKKSNETIDKQVTFYKNNIYDNHYFYYSTYKGIVFGNKKNDQNEITLFDKDIYDLKIKANVNHYYLVANYNDQFNFNSFYIIDLYKNKQKTLKLNNLISFDSYVQGVVNNKVYIIDKTNKKQYQIDVVNNEIEEIGDEHNDAKNYVDHEWITVNINVLIKDEIKFKEKTTIQKEEYVFLKQVGNEKLGYYYYYQKNKDKYDLYRTLINDNNMTYIGQTDKINNIVYSKEGIYYLSEDNVIFQSDEYGHKIIMTNKELLFNETLFYGFYIK